MGPDSSRGIGWADYVPLAVNLPELVAHTTMDTDTISVLRTQLQDILKRVSPLDDRHSLTSLNCPAQIYRTTERQILQCRLRRDEPGVPEHQQAVIKPLLEVHRSCRTLLFHLI